MHNRRRKIKLIAGAFVVLAFLICFKILYSVLTANNIYYKNSFKNNSMNSFADITYKSYENNKSNVFIKSSEVTEENNGIINFKNLISTFKISKEETATISSDKSRALTSNAKQCEFIGNVKLSTENGLFVETEKLFVDFNKNIAYGNHPIQIAQDNIKLTAQQKCFFDMNGKKIILTGQVKGYINEDLVIADKMEIEFGDVLGKDLKKVKAFGHPSYKTSQYYLKAVDNIEYNQCTVEAHNNVILKYKEKGNAYDVNANHLFGDIKENILNKIWGNGNFVIKTDSYIIKGNRGTLFDNILTVNDNVTILNNKNTIICESATFNTNTNELKIYKSKGLVSTKDK